MHTATRPWEANYAFSDALTLTLGARLTREEKIGDSAVHNTSGLSDPLVAPHYSHAWGAFTPKATLSYQPLRSLLTYVTASTGLKSGGYDATGSTVAGLQTPFRPEKVTNYESGNKMFTGDWNARSVFGLSFTYKR